MSFHRDKSWHLYDCGGWSHNARFVAQFEIDIYHYILLYNSVFQWQSNLVKKCKKIHFFTPVLEKYDFYKLCMNHVADFHFCILNAYIWHIEVVNKSEINDIWGGGASHHKPCLLEETYYTFYIHFNLIYHEFCEINSNTFVFRKVVSITLSPKLMNSVQSLDVKFYSYRLID